MSKNGLNCRLLHTEVLPKANLTVPPTTNTVTINPWQIVTAPDVALIDFNVGKSVETTKPIPASPHWPGVNLNAIAEYEDQGFQSFRYLLFWSLSLQALQHPSRVLPWKLRR